jgi:hypothetical protein
MNARETMSTTTWLSMVMLFMNLAVWMEAAIRLAG